MFQEREHFDSKSSLRIFPKNRPIWRTMTALSSTETSNLYKLYLIHNTTRSGKYKLLYGYVLRHPRECSFADIQVNTRDSLYMYISNTQRSTERTENSVV